MANRRLFLAIITLLYIHAQIIEARTFYVKPKPDVYRKRSVNFAQEIGTLIRDDPMFEAFYVDVDDSVSEQYLNSLEDIELAEDLSKGEVVFGDVTPDDPRYVDQWHMTKLKIGELWSLVPWDQTTAKNVTVAICDQGYDFNHEDLDGSRVVYKWDYNNWDADPTDPSTDGHGVHVAGIFSATTNNAKGVAGLAYGVNLFVGRVADEKRTISVDNLFYCVDDAVAQGADIINLSLGIIDADYSSFQTKIDTYTNNGVLIASCAGNDYNTGNRPWYPAAYASAFAVTNIDENDARFSASNIADYIDISAPGTNIWSTDLNNGYRLRTGCSMATPVVTGLAALIKAIRPDYKAQQIMDLFTSTAVDLGDAGKDSTFGYGRIDPVAAAKKLLNQPPAINANSAYNIIVGQAFSVDIDCYSVESFDSCTSLTSSNVPAFLTVTTNSATSITISGTAASSDIGSYDASIQAVDTYSTYNTKTVTFIVSETPVPLAQDPPIGSQTPSAGSEPTTGNNGPTGNSSPTTNNSPTAKTPQSKGPVSKPVFSGVNVLSVSFFFLIVSFML